MSSVDPTPIDRREARLWTEKVAAVRSFAEFARGRAMPSDPLEVFLEVSNVCDLKCAMCTYFSALNPSRLLAMKSAQRGFMEWTAAEDALAGTLRRTLMIHCYGFGEPTIHPQFIDFLANALEFEAMVDFFTNGMHLEEELARFMVEKRVFRIAVSFSGATKQDYEAVYLGGRFDQVLSGIERVSRWKTQLGATYPTIAINSIAFRHHIEKLPAFVQMMADRGVTAIDVKQLVPYPDIPELYREASIYRPWIEGPTVEEALRVADARGVRLDVSDYLAHGVRDEEEHAARLRAWDTDIAQAARAELAESIHDYATAAASLVPLRPRRGGEVGARVRTGEVVQRDRAALREHHSVKRIGAAARDHRAFYCMEPFKTMYVRRSGEVKPCCFAHDDAPLLGNVERTPASEIWSGPDYDVVRQAILNGLYPEKLCGSCVKHGMAPEHHSVAHHLLQYTLWWQDAFGGRFPAEVEPLVHELLENGDGPGVVDRIFMNAPRLAVDEADHRQLEVLLRLCDSFASCRPELDSVVEGYVDMWEPTLVHGWLWSPLFQHLRLPVTVWADREVVAEGVASEYRGDLYGAGKGDGRFAFTIEVPSALANRRITIGNTRCELYAAR